jgi:hypothetical protein
MTTIKKVALVAAGILCASLAPTGVLTAGAETASNEAAYKAATDTDPHLPLTAYQEKMRAQKIQAATSGAASPVAKTGSASSVTSAAAMATASTPSSASLTQDQNPQKTSYWCGPATVNEALGQLGKWFTQEQLASELRTTTAGTAWSGGGTSPSGFPVPDVMNRHQSSNYYIPESVPSTPSDSDVDRYKSALTNNIATVRAPVIGNAWTTPYSEFWLVGHPHSATIHHWFDIYGYRISSGTTYTEYEDSVHGAGSIDWHESVPAYSELPSHQIAHIVGGRGYVW